MISKATIRVSLAALFLAAITFQGYQSGSATAKESPAPLPNAIAKNTNQRLRRPTEKRSFHSTSEIALSTGEFVRPTVADLSKTQIESYSDEIDRLVDEDLKANGIKPAKQASDEVFVRRVYLDVIGRIPTLDETNAFLDSRHRSKRGQLIDELLDSYGYVSRQFNFWADVLRAKTDLRNIAGQPYIDFIKDSLSQNKSYDEFVREMLTAEGPNLQRGNGAVGFYLRDNNMQEDNMSNTVRVFLGTRLECAQCHDHPFDVWTQRDYFEMVAFTGGIRYRAQPIDSEHAREVGQMRQDKSLSREERQAIRKIIEPMTFGISGTGTGLARLPEDYEAGEGDPHEIITGKTMFEKSPLVDAEVPDGKSKRSRRRRVNKKSPQQIPNATELGSREKYAEWLTAVDNPRFATVVANRMWKQAMGLGLVEPVDTFTEETKGSNPELLEYLTKLMVEVDFDLKQYLRAIYNTEVYQRVSHREEVVNSDEHRFNGPIVRRMKAEQIWDSLLTLAIADTDKRAAQPSGRALRYLPVKDMYEGYERLRELDSKEIKQLAAAYSARRNGDKGAVMKTMSEVFKDEQVAEPKFKKFAKEMAELNQRLKRAKKNKNFQLVRKLAVERKELAAYQRRQRKSGDLLRASELPSPAKPGHFLREFGQSDREQIDNANQEAAVTQSLSLMNGLVEKTVTRSPYSVLMKNVQAGASPDEKVRIAYLSMLSRHPKSYESKEWIAALQSDGQVGVSDLIWTLANSVEFVFVK